VNATDHLLAFVIVRVSLACEDDLNRSAVGGEGLEASEVVEQEGRPLVRRRSPREPDRQDALIEQWDDPCRW